ncbi:fluoride efflux transporter FluC [Arcanobacterium pinnipediorum]|uniref:Fluoride-specific ion channel FluC n=1 Tax=Arcanobacterium pinnipediorum TaxID=1503041 RepID=A0ABY5AHV2_9ACTO|nr:CrcB family protein [Arcanobacterium pinnipediorum]USR78788.1 CrcB family protein [Arcanobacterium pinnipediorum]
MRALRLSACIFAGAFLGVVIRWTVLWIFPDTNLWPVFFINIVGSFLLGWFTGQINHSHSWSNVSDQTRLFLTTGLLGGLTTYSTFSLDIVGLAATQIIWALGFAGLQLFLGIGAAMCGLTLGAKAGRR